MVGSKVMVGSKRQHTLKPTEKPADKPEEKVAPSIVDDARYPAPGEILTTKYLWIRGVGEIKHK